jgi:hypothetical protein
MNDWIAFVVRDLCEIPDRDSPENAPEMLLVSAEEIRAAIQNHADQRIADLERQLAYMRPVVEAAERTVKGADMTGLVGALRRYEARKPK